MRHLKRFLVLATGLLSACGGGGGGGAGSAYCSGTFFGGDTTWACSNCINNLSGSNAFAAAIDDNAGTFKEFGIGTNGGQITISATAPSGNSFPTGANAGALLRFPIGTFSSIGVQFNTYNGSTVVDTLAGGETAAGNVSGAGTDKYYSLTSSGTFDKIEAVVSVTGNTDPALFRIYEFCGDN